MFIDLLLMYNFTQGLAWNLNFFLYCSEQYTILIKYGKTRGNINYYSAFKFR